MIYFFCPDFKGATGGIKVYYRHVSLLNKHGIPAAILHSKTGFKLTWFEHDAPVCYVEQTRITAEDILVFPESFTGYFSDSQIPKGLKLWAKQHFSPSRHKYYVSQLYKTPAKKVIYNQGAYLTFSSYPGNPHNLIVPYQDPQVIGTVMVSDDNVNYLKYAFPSHAIYRIHLSNNAEMFTYTAIKKKQIAYMPGKSPADAKQVINMLNVKGIFKNYELVAISGKTEAQVAQIMHDSLIFMSFGWAEGCPLPPMEAMMSGCMVVGYHGRGGREYFKPEFCYPVEAGDIVTYAQSVEKALATYEQTPDTFFAQTRQAADYINQHYNQQTETHELITIWRELLRK